MSLLWLRGLLFTPRDDGGSLRRPLRGRSRELRRGDVRTRGPHRGGRTRGLRRDDRIHGLHRDDGRDGRILHPDRT